MTKLLWHSNAPWAPTGYGTQTALFAPRLAEHYEVFISANYGLEGAPLVWNGLPVLPGLGQTHGNEAIPGHVTAVFNEPREGLVVTLYDAQVFDPGIFKRVNGVCWTPVDHNPPPPRLTSFFRQGQAIPLAMSRYGEEQLAEFDPIYVPHGVDTSVYRPRGRDEARAMMGIPKDKFLVGMVAANKGRPSRKCFQQAFEAFRYFRQKHDDADLYVHTTVAPEYAGGEDLLALADSLQIELKTPNQYPLMFSPVSDDRMSMIYSAFDVLLNASMGEGFGIPIAEAQACGVPVIVTDFSAMPEVMGAGWKVSCSSYWTGQASWMGVPNVGEIVDALEACHGLTDGKRNALAVQARQHVVVNYDVDTVFEDHMLPAMKEVEERIGELKPVKVAA